MPEEPIGLSTKAEPERRWSTTELKGWRDKAQLKTLKSFPQTERRVTKTDPDGQGCLKEK